MSLLLGALGGLGQGMASVADIRIQNIDQQSLAQMQESLAIAKERRVEEMQKRQEQRGEESTIRAEGRALSNADLARKSQFDFENDPANVGKSTASAIAKQRALDDYKYANQAREAAYQGAMSEAKYGPMYEARAANATARVASGKMDKATELQYKRMVARADAARKDAENATDEVKQLEYMDQAMRFEQAAQDLLSSGSAALPGETRPTNANPLGLDLGALRDPEGKSDQDLVKDIEATGAKADLGDTEHDAIRQVSVMAKQDKVDRAVGGKGLLGQSRAQILDEIDRLTNGNFDIPQDASTPELAKMLQQLRKDAFEQSKRDARQKAAEDEKEKSKAEKEAKDMKRMEGLLNYKPKYFGQRDSGM
jgi:membrane protein involved in colicin uptake